jgi:cytochrome b6-f complex iron-sulfur subunit
MDRKQFLSALGISASSLLLASCLGSCKKSSAEDVSPAPDVDFTIDISQPAYSALNNPGEYIYANGVIIAKTIAGNLIAVSKACTHAGTDVVYQSNANNFYCPNHGAVFTAAGTVTTGPAQTALKQYIVSVTGNTVRISG